MTTVKPLGKVPGQCQCRRGCLSQRRACVREWQGCSPSCTCQRCQNIFNKINSNELSECSRDNIRKLLALVAKGGLDQQTMLPCHCQAVPLRVLLLSETFLCQRCSSFYRYSFCWGQIVEDDQTYHCEECEDCYDWRDWGEESCRRCTERDEEMDWREEHGYE